MSLVKMRDLDSGHSLQPVVPRQKGMESADHFDAVLRIDNEIADARTRTAPFAGYTTAEDDPVAIAIAKEDRLAAEAEEDME